MEIKYNLNELNSNGISKNLLKKLHVNTTKYKCPRCDNKRTMIVYVTPGDYMSDLDHNTYFHMACQNCSQQWLEIEKY